MKYALLLITAICATYPALAADSWRSYANPRFGYSAEVPPRFTLVQESDNGDGAVFESSDGARLLIFGAFVEDGGFATDSRQRIEWDRQQGWKVTYEKVTPGWASYSGSRPGAILYARGVTLCVGSAAYFQLEYPPASLNAYDSIINRMIRSLRPAEGCNQAPTAAPGPAPN